MKKLFIIVMGVLLVGVISSCAQSKSNSTDLSEVKLDGISIGDSVGDIVASNYTKSDRFPINEENETVSYEEWRISISDDDTIIKIDADVYEGVVLSIGDVDCENIDDVINLLGDRYKNSWYDKEQQLEEIVYIDQEHDMKVSFIYSSSNKRLVFVIMERGVGD